jgi:hypothetical protein
MSRVLLEERVVTIIYSWNRNSQLSAWGVPHQEALIPDARLKRANSPPADFREVLASRD